MSSSVSEEDFFALAQEVMCIMIQLEGISKTYSGEKAVHALTDVNLHIPAAIFGIIGPSGAGKSTLLRCINLLEARCWCGLGGRCPPGRWVQELR